MTRLERLSIELHDRCGKECWFCYNASAPTGTAAWQPDDVIAFALDCARHGVQALSLGGGEPLEYPGLFAILHALRGHLYRSLTSNGLHLDHHFDQLVAAAPDRVHLSIHFPGRTAEVTRVISQLTRLTAAGIPTGINLLVSSSHLDDAIACATQLRAAGIANDRIVYLPMRGRDTPTASQLSTVAGGRPFQSMTCLSACGPSPRFASLDSHRRVAWCSYTRSRHPLSSLTHASLLASMHDLALEPCDETAGGLVALRRQGSRP